MEIQVVCPCGITYEFTDRDAGRRIICTACGNELLVPDAEPGESLSELQPAAGGNSGAVPLNSTTRSTSPMTENICPVCQSPLTNDESVTTCSDCRTCYHTECWEENGGCGVYGCSQVPATDQRGELEIPISYWGQENKPCPACGVEILAMARRCRHCGATFASERPEDSSEFQRREELSTRLPSLRKGVLWFFVFSVVTLTAPFAALFGAIWFWGRREDVRNLPSIYQTLGWTGLVAGIGQTVIIIVTTVLYTAFRS